MLSARIREWLSGTVATVQIVPECTAGCAPSDQLPRYKPRGLGSEPEACHSSGLSPDRALGVLRAHGRTDDLRAETDLLRHHAWHVERDGPRRRELSLASGNAEVVEQLLKRAWSHDSEKPRDRALDQKRVRDPARHVDARARAGEHSAPVEVEADVAIEDDEHLVLTGVDVSGRAEALRHRGPEHRQRAFGDVAWDEELP